MKYASATIFLAASLLLGEHANAQTGIAASFGLYVYPSNGQAPDVQAKDEGECYQWGKQTTGVDPANPMAGAPPQQPAQQPPPQGGAAAGGAMRGAAGGALIGNIADEDAGEYALAGAVIGGVRGAKKASQQQAQAAQQASAQSQAQAQQRVQLFKNAFSACMEGRKYTVK
jgi:hypothetical protein